MENNDQININTADEDTLSELHGIGSSLAKRIINTRPFASVDDLNKVTGISENDVARLRPYLTISDETKQENLVETAEERVELKEEIESGEKEILEDIDVSASDVSFEDVIVDDPEQTIEESVEFEEDQEPIEVGEPETATVPDDEKPLAETLEPSERIPEETMQVQQGYVTRGGACGLVLIGGFLSLILAIAITLGIISSINRGQLSYASPAQVAALQSQNETLSTQNQALSEDIASLRARMDNLESLGGKVSEMESDISSMQSEINQLQTQLTENQATFDELIQHVENLDEDIQSISVHVDQFQSFLDGLRTVMDNLFSQTPPVEDTP